MIGKRRIVMVGPPSASGRITTLTRSPPGRRASTIGEDSSTRRLTRLTIRSTTFSNCCSVLNDASTSSSRPARSTQTLSSPLIMISLMVASSNNGSKAPNPNASSTNCRTILVRCPAV